MGTRRHLNRVGGMGWGGLERIVVRTCSLTMLPAREGSSLHPLNAAPTPAALSSPGNKIVSGNFGKVFVTSLPFIVYLRSPTSSRADSVCCLFFVYVHFFLIFSPFIFFSFIFFVLVLTLVRTPSAGESILSYASSDSLPPICTVYTYPICTQVHPHTVPVLLARLKREFFMRCCDTNCLHSVAERLPN